MIKSINMNKQRGILIILLIIAIGALLFMFWQNSQVPGTDSNVQNDLTGATPHDPSTQVPDNQNSNQPKPGNPDSGNGLAYDLEQDFTSKLWMLESIILEGQDVNMDVKIGKPLTLQFDRSKKSYGGFGGCNGFGGEYIFKQPYDFDFGLTISTQIYCEGGASEFEQAYFKALDKVTNVGIKGEQLVFADESANTTQLVYSPSK